MLDDRINPDRLYSPKQLSNFEGVCLASVYARMGRGEYGQVFKDGAKTAILGESILERRRKNLKPASFKAPVPQAPRFHTIKPRS